MVDVGEMSLAKRSIRRPCSGSGAVNLVLDPFHPTQLQINNSFVLTITGASGNPPKLLLCSQSQGKHALVQWDEKSNWHSP